MIHKVFQWCVDILIYLAKVFGITYEEINVYIFCIIWPILTVLMFIIILYQRFLIKKLDNR